MPKPFDEDERKTIQQRLRQQGRDRFATFGLRKTTVEELATAAGISKGAFYLFYESKEALFMEVVEEAEVEFRHKVLAVLELPGPSPQARLYAALHRAFTLWKSIPILRFFTRSDYELLSRRISAETLQAHLHSDLRFSEEIIARCHATGILVRIRPEQLDGLLHLVFFASLHEDDFGPGGLTSAIELVLQLIVALCLGEVEFDWSRSPINPSEGEAK